MKLLITGKNGQVGNSLVEQLNDLPEIVSLSLGKEELDITNETQVNQVISNFNPDIIINAAAYTAVDKAESEIELANAININGPRNLAKAANKINASLIHLSTDYVFSGDKLGVYNEKNLVNPQGVYGQSKLAGEQAVEEECPAHVILRTAWVFSEHGNNFVKTMLRLAQTRNTLSVVSDQFGGPTYAGDIANTILYIAQELSKGNAAYGIYHYSGLPHVSWQEFASEIFKTALAEKEIISAVMVNSITTEEYPTLAKRPANSKLDCSKIANNFSIQASNWKVALDNIKRFK